jgi:hypothetical protein
MRSKLAPVLAAAMLAGFAGSAAAYDAYTPTPSVLRVGPGVGYAAIATIPANAPVNVTSCGMRWCQVSYMDTAGYVAKPLLVAGLAPLPNPVAVITLPLAAAAAVATAVLAPTPFPSPAAPIVAAY